MARAKLKNFGNNCKDKWTNDHNNNIIWDL